jgi:8-oxo-dGTP pyrophosphatase MutT (NUDIX family)
MAHHPIETHYFVLVVVRLGHRFLLVHERKHGESWYLPAGKLEEGESFVEAAMRETLEEAGVPIVVEGILRLEHTPYHNAARMRVIFVARPKDDTPPLNEANADSLEARWVSLEEMRELNLRGEEVRHIFEYVSKGAPIYPLSLLTFEGAPYLYGGAK